MIVFDPATDWPSQRVLSTAPCSEFACAYSYSGVYVLCLFVVCFVVLCLYYAMRPCLGFELVSASAVALVCCSNVCTCSVFDLVSFFPITSSFCHLLQRLVCISKPCFVSNSCFEPVTFFPFF